MASTIAELGRFISDACNDGDSVTGIANRAGVPECTVNELRNGRFSGRLGKEHVLSLFMALGSGEPLTKDEILAMFKNLRKRPR